MTVTSFMKCFETRKDMCTLHIILHPGCHRDSHTWELSYREISPGHTRGCHSSQVKLSWIMKRAGRRGHVGLTPDTLTQTDSLSLSLIKAMTLDPHRYLTRQTEEQLLSGKHTERFTRWDYVQTTDTKFFWWSVWERLFVRKQISWTKWSHYEYVSVIRMCLWSKYFLCCCKSMVFVFFCSKRSGKNRMTLHLKSLASFTDRVHLILFICNLLYFCLVCSVTCTCHIWF